ncbi:MAG: hypothetical protein GY799_16440, partial [Desulfobulbaceae bacterium]|nr:hypothetical protein [Desulfobulbaceae bacterium]
MNVAFVPASDNIQRLAQLNISPESVRKIVEQEGKQAKHSGRIGQTLPDFTYADCVEKTVITGMDGVMVPLVTEEQKVCRRKTESEKRKRQKRKSTARACRPKKGSDGDYKEFKLATFYDKDKSHQYAVGTSGDSEQAGRMLRKVSVQLEIDKAEVKYSVSDGAPWIEKQYNAQLPMLDDNILDAYHFKSHLTEAGYALYGENSQESVLWRKQMYDVAMKNGSLVLLDKLKECRDSLEDKNKRESVESLRKYISKRIAMTDYPDFMDKGYDIGSGPTESFCKRLTKRLKGSGMKWDSDNAESIMALGSVYYSNLWDKYWD